jgi:SNF2 family DNA or RNA helicase
MFMQIIESRNFYLTDLNLLDYVSEQDRNFLKIIINAVNVGNKTYYKFHRFFTVEIVLSLISNNQLKIARELIENTVLYHILFDHKPDIPKHLDKAKRIFKVELMPHQSKFVQHYGEYKDNLKLRGYYLAFDVGTGKTLTALYTSLAYGTKVIVVCPKTLILNWLDEFEKLTNIPREQICAFPLDQPNRNHIAIITNFNNVSKLHVPWNYNVERIFLIIDEAQVVRYADTQTIQSLYKFVIANNINDVLLLSGTPIKGRYAELSGAFLLLDPLFDMDAYPYFIKAYNSAYATHAIDLIKHRLSLSMIRVTRSQISSSLSLPPKHEIVIETNVDDIDKYVVDSIIEQARDQSSGCLQQVNQNYNTYKQNLIDVLSKIEQIDTDNQISDYVKMIRENVEQNQIKLTRDLVYARKQIYDFLQSRNEHTLAEQFNKAMSQLLMGKLICFTKELSRTYKQRLIELVMELYEKNIKLIKDLVSRQERIIIFTNYRYTLEAIKQTLEKHGIRNIVTVTGEQSLKERKKSIQIFKQQPGTILIATYSSLSFGFTLTEGRIVMYADLPFRDVDLHQAIARVYRFSQTKETYVYYLKLKSDKVTIQQKQELLIEKFKEKVKQLFEVPASRNIDWKRVLAQ